MLLLELYNTRHEQSLQSDAVDSADQLNEYIPRRKDANYAEFAPGTQVTHSLLGPKVGTVVDVLAIPREDRRESGIPVQVGDRIYWMAPQGLTPIEGMAEGKKKKKKKSSRSLRGYFFPGYAYYGAGDSGEGGDGGGESKNHGMEEAKGLTKRVRIVKGPEAGKTGTIGEVRHGLFKGAPKTFTVDIDGGGSIQLPKEALRLLKDQSVAEGTKLVADGSVINVYYNGTHIGNIFTSTTKDTPYKAYSKHWDMSRLFKSKKAATDWLAQTHQTAIKEEAQEQGMAEGETKYDAAWDEKVQRLGQMAKQGERKTVWDPVRRVYKTVPVNTAKPTQENIFSLTEKNSTTQTAQSVNEDSNSGAAEQAILNRIMTAHIDLLRQFGPEKVMQAVEEVAYNVGDLAEIGTSDVSGWVRQVRQILGA
jgi:hypothetical protein